MPPEGLRVQQPLQLDLSVQTTVLPVSTGFRGFGAWPRVPKILIDLLRQQEASGWGESLSYSLACTHELDSTVVRLLQAGSAAGLHTSCVVQLRVLSLLHPSLRPSHLLGRQAKTQHARTAATATTITAIGVRLCSAAVAAAIMQAHEAEPLNWRQLIWQCATKLMKRSASAFQ